MKRRGSLEEGEEYVAERTRRDRDEILRDQRDILGGTKGGGERGRSRRGRIIFYVFTFGLTAK